VVLVHSEQLLDDIADHLGTLTAAKSMKALAIILAVPYEDVRQALAVQGCLHRSGLIHLQREYSSYLRSKLDLVSAQLVDKLLVKANDVMDLFVGTINKSAAAELTLGLPSSSITIGFTTCLSPTGETTGTIGCQYFYLWQLRHR
jgi:hypothetical protein